MARIRGLGYVVVRGPLGEWEQFGQEKLGLQLAAGEFPGELRFRSDERAYRLIVKEAGEERPGLAALGFETATGRDLEELAADLAKAGFAVTSDKELAAHRQVRELYTAKDPDGNVLELHYGPLTDHHQFVSPTGARFVTGDLGVGHVFMFTRDLPQTLDFYQNQLGFLLSDTIDIGPTTGYFLHCNPRHHSVAVAQLDALPPGLGHLMLEVDDLTAVGHALDRAQAGSSVAVSIGEHTNDLVTSFYLTTPSGFQIEYGWNGRLIDDANWTVSHYASPSIWGHKRQALKPA